jgi:hypothetical protein
LPVLLACASPTAMQQIVRITCDGQEC